MKVADKRRLQRTAAKWQRRLGLLEWQTAVSHASPEDEGRVGETASAKDMRLAVIRVHPEVVGRDDEELVVLHEVLHLQPNVYWLLTHGLEDDPHAKEHIEDLLDDVARYLLRLEQECRGP